MSDGIYTPTVVEILDLFYAEEGQEPDWAAIRTRLHNTTESQYSVTVALLRAFFAVYEDEAAAQTVLWRMTQDLPD